MNTEKALEMFECITNLDDSRLMSYLCKHVGDIREVAKVGKEAIKERQRIDKLLDKWEGME